MSIDEKRDELKRAFYEALRPLVKRTAIQYAEAQDCIEDLIVSLGNATAAGEMEKGDYDVHPSV